MADIATAFASWSATSSSNQPDNSDSIGPNTLADNLRVIQAVVRSAVGGDGTIASASTADLSTVEANYINVTGTTTITALGTLSAGVIKILKFAGILTFTHNGTSLILPGAANITTAAGDVAIMRSEGSGNWRCLSYHRAAGGAIGLVIGTDVQAAMTAASQGEMEAGTEAALRSMSPLRVAQAIAALGITSFASTAEVTGTHTTGTITSGTAALTVASGTGTANGDYVVGEGITPGTTISSGGGTTSITLSANAGATLSSDPVSFYKATKSLSPGNAAGMLCRAWVNFNGTGTVAIRASFNVTSITDNGAGDYTVNFTTAMPDANYAAIVTGHNYNSASTSLIGPAVTPYSAGSLRIYSSQPPGSLLDTDMVNVTIFR